MKKYIPYILFTAGLVMMLCRRPAGVQHQQTIYDTVTVHDTLRDTILLPVKTIVHRIDTVFLPSAADSSIRQRVTVPIERKEYITENYRAVVEGFSASLAEMEIYPATRIIQPSSILPPQKRHGTRFPSPQLGIGAGVGYDPFSRSLHPVITLGIYLPITSRKGFRQAARTPY